MIICYAFAYLCLPSVVAGCSVFIEMYFSHKFADTRGQVKVLSKF